ncbi:MAG: DUF1232 domain-containing protein [Dehalococcoidia bacterium]|nr:DUF1232 domain-containing protein [Dehalococcoidia bacterium]
MLEQLTELKKTAKRDTIVSWMALRDERAPWYVKAVAAAMAIYTISPVDVVPDLIPFSGILDDALVIPAAIALMVRLIPTPLRAELTARAEERIATKRPHSHVGEAIIIFCIVGITAIIAWLVWFR